MDILVKSLQLRAEVQVIKHIYINHGLAGKVHRFFFPHAVVSFPASITRFVVWISSCEGITSPDG